MNIYSFDTAKCKDPGAPKLIPVNAGMFAKNSSNYIFADSLVGFLPGMIDVVNNFQWTTSPPGPQSRQEVPRIILREKRLRTNAIVAAAAYYLMSAASSAGTLGSRLGETLPDGLLNTVGGFFSNITSSPALQGAASSITGTFEQYILNSASNLFTGNKDARSILNSTVDGLNSQYLKPYEGLYITEDTKFNYYFPYFSDSWNDVKNSFSENDSMFDAGTNYAKGVSEIKGATDALARFANFKEPGIYIERPQFYNFASTGDTITFSFPLINTGCSTYDDVRLNWQLLFLLMYQNRPNRRSRELIDPSVMYEVSIPGVKYMPYAYMSELKIDYFGSRRHMALEVPSPTGNTTINTIVPDAFKVSITLTGLIAESRNFLMAMLQDKEDIVKVVNMNTYNPFAEIYSSFIDSYNAEREG